MVTHVEETEWVASVSGIRRSTLQGTMKRPQWTTGMNQALWQSQKLLEVIEHLSLVASTKLAINRQIKDRKVSP
jgi:hypothetical protein